jgi:hypothetical protein
MPISRATDTFEALPVLVNIFAAAMAVPPAIVCCVGVRKRGSRARGAGVGGVGPLARA